MDEMHQHRRTVLATVLSIVALAFATLAAYLGSILWLGEWKYTELLLPAFATILAAVFAVVGVSLVLRRQAGVASVVCLAGVLTTVCALITVSVYFGLLANCNLSCGNRVAADSVSPNGHWKAVWLVEGCASISRACPEISHVAVLPNGAEPHPLRGESFSATGVGDLRMEWKANNRLVISYIGTTPTSLRILHKPDRLRTVVLEYLPIGWL